MTLGYAITTTLSPYREKNVFRVGSGATTLNANGRAIGANISNRSLKNILNQSLSEPPTTIWVRGVTTVSGERITLDWAYFTSYAADFWTGATVEVWRISSGVLSKIRTTTVDVSTATYVDLVPGGGSAVAVGDMIVVTQVTKDVGLDKVDAGLATASELRILRAAPYVRVTGGETEWNGDTAYAPSEWVDDPTDGVFARYNPTGTMTAYGKLELWRTGNTNQTFTYIMQPGTTYTCRFELRSDASRTFELRHSSIPTHEITEINGTPTSATFPQTFTATTSFQWFEVKFDTSAFLTSGTSQLHIMFTSAGQYDLRRFEIYEDEVAFGALTAAEDARVRAANLDHIRDHNIVKTNEGGRAYSLRRLITEFIHYSIQNTVELGIPRFWLQPEWYIYEDADNLVEYLSGASGSGEWADLRVELGRTAPWTDDLSFIFEISNETWNSSDGFYNFPSMTDSVTAATWTSAQIYGKWFQMFINKMETAPSYNAADFEYVIGGRFNNNYGDLAARQCPDATIVTRAPYIGGWEVGSGGTAETPQSFYEVLNRPATVVPDQLADNDTWISDARANGANVSLVGGVYEDAVSFNTLPPSVPIEQLRFSKTVAAGTAWIDKIAQQATKYSLQSYFTVNFGEDWASHEPVTGVTYPAHQWNEIWNAHFAGSVKQVETYQGQARNVSVDATGYLNVPDVGCYVVDTATGYSVLVTNRNIPFDAISNLDDLYDANDDGAREFRVVVPSGSYSVTRYSMSGAWDAQNLDDSVGTYDDTIAIVTTALGASGGEVSGTIPAASAYVFVFTAL